MIDSGVTYLDTAMDYGKGLSETRVGDEDAAQEVWLATKVPPPARTRDEVLREVEKSLKRLQTDRADLLHLHSLTTGEDLQKIEAKDGAMKALYELREQKVALHRDDQPHRRRGDGQSDRTQRSGLRADGDESVARAPV